jgi:4-hydroxyphenylpyruvate dioxygenase
MRADSAISRHVEKHGDGGKVLAVTVDDAEKSYYETLARGAKEVHPPTTLSDEHGKIVLASIQTYGETIHTFVERKAYTGAFMPGFSPAKPSFEVTPIGIEHVDHCVGNVELGQMDEWVKFYQDVMGFKLLVTFDDKDISTEYSALMSKVVSNGNGYIKFPINEPADGKKKSQIEEYLEFYEGPGVQHIALATKDIIHTVSELRKRGVEFLRVPDVYYDTLTQRVGTISEDLAKIKALNILVDRDDEGYLLQIFTKPVEDRPTLFFELIQREGATSFGKGNFKALFESIEAEQALRGNL